MDRRFEAVRYPAETVISAAQNQEDVVLFRALGGKKSGFYIDVGAGDPNADSVTNWFYRVGWTGINIEPNPLFVSAYETWRPRDINKNVGVSNQIAKLPFFKVLQNAVGHGWGLSSFDPGTISLARELGFAVEELEIDVIPLSSIVENHAANKEIDFLKIDVEGLERAVLSSIDLTRTRPTIICLEAVRPNSSIPSHADWEDILTSGGYVFALFDGVNAYYLKSEASYLLSQFNTGVCVNDRYRRATKEDFDELLRSGAAL